MIEKLAYAENNIIALLILIILLLNMKYKDRKMRYDSKLFFGLLSSTAMIAILDTIMSIINGGQGVFLRETNLILTTIYFVLNPLPFMFWSLYIDFYIHKSVRRLKNILPIVAIPAAIIIILFVMSLYNKGVFYIDENNIYRRGHLFPLIAALYYSYCIAIYVQAFNQRKNIRKKDYYALFSFGIIPSLAGILQLTTTSRTYIWLSIAISCLIIYLNIQNSEINEDYLTDLYNRRELDSYLRNSIRNQQKDESIFMIMIDLNYFKEINDMYGHIEGDKALKYTADILVDSFRSEDFISRYGGDEFVIVLKLENLNSKDKIISRIRKKFEEFNASNTTPYDISIGIGYDVYNPELYKDSDEFIKHVDGLMYKDKKRVKFKFMNVMKSKKY